MHLITQFLDHKNGWRSWQAWLTGILFTVAAIAFGSFTGADVLGMVGRACIGVGVYYMAYRWMVRTRTHQLEDPTLIFIVNLVDRLVIGLIIFGAGM